MARKIVVTSGKGGVGKTTVAANLAIRLGALGKRALVIDLDTGLNDLDVDTGVENLVVYDLIDCIEGRCRAKQAIIECPQGKNAFVLPCVRNVRAESGFADKLKELYVGLDSSFDFIFTDSPAGIGDGFRLAISSSDEAILVTTPHLASLRDADKTAAMLRGVGLKRIKLVVNKVRGDLVAGGLSLSPEAIESALKIPLLGVIPSDDEAFLRDAGQIPPDSRSFKAFKVLAANLANDKRKIYDCLSGYRGFAGYIRRRLKNGL